MKHAKIIRKLSLAYWEVYSRKLRLAAAANDWQQVKKAAYTLEGIVLSAAALGVSLDELQTADNKATEKR